jgi:hypothetical protein
MVEGIRTSPGAETIGLKGQKNDGPKDVPAARFLAKKKQVFPLPPRTPSNPSP